MPRRGRSPRGEEHYFARLTDQAVREIRALHAQGEPYAELARAFGVAESTVKHVVKLRSWKHVDNVST